MRKSLNLLTADVLHISHEMCLLTAFVASRTGKIIKKCVLKLRGENFLQNGVLDFGFR